MNKLKYNFITIKIKNNFSPINIFLPYMFYCWGKKIFIVVFYDKLNHIIDKQQQECLVVIMFNFDCNCELKIFNGH